MSESIPVGVVDNHTLYRNGLVELLKSDPQIDVVVQVNNGEELFDILRDSNILNPEVVLLDLQLPGINGFECLRLLRSEYPDIKIIVLTLKKDNPFILKSLKEGARSFLLKEENPEEIISAIRLVYDKKMYINEHIIEALLEDLKEMKNDDSDKILSEVNLTGNEEEVLICICSGLTNTQIAKKLHKSVRTVESYRQRILDKTKSSNTAALVSWAFRNNFFN